MKNLRFRTIRIAPPLFLLLTLLASTEWPGRACAGQQESIPVSSDLEYIFVHGLSGWGSYDTTYAFMPYWGMLGGDLIRYLNGQGYPSYAASVAPEGSAWDRACELYAQLTGTVTDYGKEHSERCGHERFGRDFSGDPLIPDWAAGRKLVLLGHSFGGAAIRLFSELLADGSPEEQTASEPNDLSPFFAGGQGDRLHALVTLAAPTNGTTAYDLTVDESFDRSAVKIPESDQRAGRVFANRKKAEKDDRSPDDYAAFDMFIDNALALNEQIRTLPDVYYFAIPCSATRQTEDGSFVPDPDLMEGMFRQTSALMGAYTGTTAGGFEIDESWRENDGLVNTVSAMAPLGAPSTAYDPACVETGIWNIMPVYQGDHMSLQGGMTRLNRIRPFYMELLQMIDQLPVS